VRGLSAVLGGHKKVLNTLMLFAKLIYFGILAIVAGLINGFKSDASIAN
jgi:hypothetical protein